MKHKFITAGVLMALSAGVLAEDHRPSRLVERLDQNGDGLISIDEFQPPRDMGRGLMDADSDGDGILTTEELMAQHQARAAKMQEKMAGKMAEHDARMQEHVNALDRDGDGTITPEEARLATFDRMDRNDDGHLSAEELRPPRNMKDKRHRGDGRHRPPRGNGEKPTE